MATCSGGSRPIRSQRQFSEPDLQIDQTEGMFRHQSITFTYNRAVTSLASAAKLGVIVHTAGFSPPPDGAADIRILQDEGFHHGGTSAGGFCPPIGIFMQTHLIQAAELGALAGFFHPFTFQNQLLYL